MNTKELGNRGEDIAVKYLKKHGYKILERNYRKKGGEIDIIALKKGCISFIEVKWRENAEFAVPSINVTITKQRHIISVAKAYLTANKSDMLTSFDVIEIIDTKVNHMIGAFRSF